MNLAVAELPVVDVGPLVPLLGLFLDGGDFFPFLLGCCNLLLEYRNYFLMYMEIIVEVCLYEIVDKAPDGRTLVIGPAAVFIDGFSVPHVVGTEFGLCLSFEVRLLNLDADGSDDALTDVLGSKILLCHSLIELLEGFCHCLPHCREVCPSVAGILAVDE